MKVKEYLKQFKADGFFILDSHQEAMSEQEEGHQHADSDLRDMHIIFINITSWYRTPFSI